MASLAQILANRRNAEKSTGPQTAEGKAASSQNAVKHGLLGKRDVINSEDPEEFDGFREQMLRELNPAGPMETVLAERIVSLSWRLKRAERMQNEALDCLMAQGVAGSDGESDELGSFVQTVDSDGGDPALGRAVVKDFANGRVLERLMVYERRIEHSLYRTMSELHRMKLLRPFDSDDGVGRPASPSGEQLHKTNPILVTSAIGQESAPTRSGLSGPPRMIGWQDGHQPSPHRFNDGLTRLGEGRAVAGSPSYVKEIMPGQPASV